MTRETNDNFNMFTARVIVYGWVLILGIVLSIFGLVFLFYIGTGQLYVNEKPKASISPTLDLSNKQVRNGLCKNGHLEYCY